MNFISRIIAKHKDPEGFKAAARSAAALGCEGKWAIHPSQIALANEVFTPPAAEVEKAKRILVALQEAAAQGKKFNCGLTGPRWNDSKSDHFAWCMSLRDDESGGGEPGRAQ
jgi:citrate lyase beta subunit